MCVYLYISKYIGLCAEPIAVFHRSCEEKLGTHAGALPRHVSAGVYTHTVYIGIHPYTCACIYTPIYVCLYVYTFTNMYVCLHGCVEDPRKATQCLGSRPALRMARLQGRHDRGRAFSHIGTISGKLITTATHVSVSEARIHVDC